jgi:hypothetical protein
MMGPFVRGSQGTFGQNPGNMTLKLFASMDAASRVNFLLHQNGYFFYLGRANCMADKERRTLCRKNGTVGRIAQTYSRADAARTIVDLYHAGNTRDGEVPTPPRHFQKAKATSGSGNGQFDSSQYLIRLESSAQGTSKKIRRTYPTLPLHRLHAQATGQRHYDRGHFRRRICVC